ncbi:hypothetical protein F511_36496 [Dorcoceras hygrometricum]|uniref:Uncharacterized protein n=1 Tax=Dorcoceras hygrometricum TaxID=472368 RepID=A0A2Z7BXQ2_9LAMI|nr:hypothetical protein F511_36496 [Dorcoceras hygrometricum]
MTKAEMMEALKERKARSGGASSSRKPSKDKRKEPSERKERHKKRRSEEMGTESARETIPKDPVTEPVGTANKGTEQQSTEASYILLDTSAISFVAKPSGSGFLGLHQSLGSQPGFDLVKSVPDLTVLEAASLHFMQALVWTREATNRLFQARDEVVRTKRSMDGVFGRHNDLLKQLEEMRAQEDKEKESLRLELEETRQSSKAQVQSLEVRAQRFEEENKILQAEVEKLQGEMANSWQLEKEKFLQCKEFDSLCSTRASIFFEKGFDGCLTQFRVNGYSEEEHPASFLDVEQALADMHEDSEEHSSGSKEAPRVLISLSVCQYLFHSGCYMLGYLSGSEAGVLRPLRHTPLVAGLSSTLSSSPIRWHLVFFLLRFPQTAPIDVAKLFSRELPPRRDLKLYVVGRRALEDGYCFSLMSATTNHRILQIRKDVFRRDSSEGKTYLGRTLHHVETWSSGNIPELVIRPRVRPDLGTRPRAIHRSQ